MIETGMPDKAGKHAGGVSCAFCESTDTELFSLFGQSLIGSQYYCHNCHTVFEAVRWTEPENNEVEEESNGT
jgi:hypothetical protein